MEDFKDQFKKGSQQAREILGHTEAGQKNLEGLQKRAFDYGADKLGAEKGRDANETAGNIISKLTSGLGTSTAADVLRTGLQTAATVGLDPQNFIAPNSGMRGTVADLGKKQAVHSMAAKVLQNGDTQAIKHIVKASGDDLARAATGIDAQVARQQGLAGRISSAIAAPKANLNKLPAGTTVVLKNTAPELSAAKKLSTTAAKNGTLKFGEMVPKAQRDAVNAILERLKGAK